MIGAPRTDIWKAGLIPAPICELLDPAKLESVRDQVVWLPDPGAWRYLADPFGVQRGDATHVFVEAYDYRTKKAVIEHHELGPQLNWKSKCTVLEQSFHLSYPYLIEDEGECFMVPESHQANEVALYRARNFPGDWVREATLLSAVRAADASLTRFEGRWWMFFTILGPKERDQRELHIAYADALAGPWRRHERNPIINDRGSARPGGTPFLSSKGELILPVQDCSQTYGGALRFLRFKTLSPKQADGELMAELLTGGCFSTSHTHGMHTLSACGEMTLVDVKHTLRSCARFGIDLQRRVSRLGRALGNFTRGRS